MVHPGALRSALLGLVLVLPAGCATSSRSAESSPDTAASLPYVPAPARPAEAGAPNDAGSEVARRTTAASATPPPPRSVGDKATACLEDPLCPAPEAERLFLSADDAHDASLDCLRFVDGDGVTKDLARGRACLEREAAAGACNNESADLPRVELAIATIDGVGGPADVAKGRAFLDGCVDDVSRKIVLDHARAREADAHAAPLNFCHDYGGTTLTSNECAARNRRREETRAALSAKRVAAGLDDEGRRLFAAASKAYAVYVEAMGSYVYEVHRDGSNRNALSVAEETSLLARRTADLAKLGPIPAGLSTDGDVAYALKSVDAALAKQRSGGVPPEVASAIDDAEVAWLAYRDAEIALRLHVAAVREDDEDTARRALIVSMSRERMTDLQAR